MAALNRLQQRIKENFHETTRDITLLAAPTAPSSSYFDSAASTTEEKLREISKLLESRNERERLEGMKRVIAGISRGRDMERFFAEVVKNVVASSIEIRKLVYIYLLRFASTNSDLLLLSINTFQKDLSDPSPLIRSMSLRVLTSIRVPVIQGIVMLGLKKLVNDRNPWVRKTVAGGLAKVYDSDPSSLPQLLPLLQILLASPSPLTLGATLTAFSEMCPDRLDLLHPYYRHMCTLLVDADEWGQVVALDILTRYARTMLEKPEPRQMRKKAEEEEEDEFEGLDMDLAMLLDSARPLFQSRNPAVVLGTGRLYYHLAPKGHEIVGRELLVVPLLRLAGGNEEDEVKAVTWEVIADMAEEDAELFKAYHTRFFLRESDHDTVKLTKLRAMIALVSEGNAQSSMREFKHYIRSASDVVAEEAIRAIGHCIRTQSAVAAKGLSILMKLLNSHRDILVAQAVIVLKSVILSQSSLSSASGSLPDSRRLVARLAKGLDTISHPKARASVFWLVGQYAAQDGDDGKGMLGVGWEGVAPWVPDILRRGVKGFTSESIFVKLQILTFASKLLVLSPGNSQLVQMSAYLFTLARYDQDYDVRDRGRFLHALLRGVRSEKIASKVIDGEDRQDHSDEDEEEDLGGVVLRREQVKVVLLGKREAGHDSDLAGIGSEYDVASMSRVTKKKLAGYEDVPDWTTDPTDPSLRDSELDHPSGPTKVVSPMNQPIPTPVPVAAHLASATIPPHVASSSSLARSMASSPSGSLPPVSGILPPVVAPGRGKFQDLDAFLNSESEEEETESEDESEVDVQPRAVTAPPRSAIVPEYEDSEEEDEEESDSEEEDVGRRLLR